MNRINPFVHTFKRGNVHALFNSLTLSTVYLNEEKYKEVINLPPADLVEESFFVSGDFDALTYFKLQADKLVEKANVGLAYFLVTSECNYQCKYCFVESRFEVYQNTYMNEDVAKKGLELIKRNTNKIKIIFYGGEPLLNFKIIKFIAEEAKRINLECTYSIISNGSVMNDEIINFIKDNNVNVSISLDGLKESNDKARVDCKNQGTFNRVISTLKKLKDNNVKFGISCTISPYNLEHPEEILNILDEYEIKGFGFNLLSENANIKLSTDESYLMVKNILKAEDIICEKRLIEDRIINRKLKPFIEKKNWTRDCAGYGKQIIITPKGEVGTCHGLWPDLVNEEVKSYFDIDVNYLGKIPEHPTWKEWNARTPFNMPACWGCYGIGLCGGGCAKNSLLRKGGIWEIDDDICLLTKEAVEWTVWKYFDTSVKNKINI